MLNNIEMYGPYKDILTKPIYVKTKDLYDIDYHINSMLNIFKDGIEIPELNSIFISIEFSDNITLELSAHDYLINLIMWKPIRLIYNEIKAHHVFFPEPAITRNSLKNYIDIFIIDKLRDKMQNNKLNNIINDCISPLKFIDNFSYFLSNTINIEDDIKLMRKHPEVRKLLNSDLSHIPIEDVNNVAMELTDTLIDYIVKDDHNMKVYFQSKEGIKKKQYKEYAINIGPKPDGQGGIFSEIINSSFVNGGLKNISSLFIENSAGRVAQILSKQNVGRSGHFARLLGLNNSNSIFHKDPKYSCDTQNLQIITIKNQKMLDKFKHRYYRNSPNGVEHKIDINDTSLIGRTIHLRSPMTCASAARGEGICYKCYGDLAYINADINAGKIAAQLLSAILTQMLLSAKHLLEAMIRNVNWGDYFNEFFNVDADTITVLDDIINKGYSIIIDTNYIEREEELDDKDFNEYVSSFSVLSPNGDTHDIGNNENKLFITNEFNMIIKSKAVKYNDNCIKIPIDQSFEEISIFMVKIHNNELSRILEKLKSILDSKKMTESFNRHEILQEFVEVLLEGHVNIDSIHAELIISNQIRALNDILEIPDWSKYNEPYQILTLKKALELNPRLTVSLSSVALARQISSPLTYLKYKPAKMDLFFNVTPLEYIMSSKEKLNENV